MTKTEKINELNAKLDNVIDELTKDNEIDVYVRLVTNKLILEGQLTILNIKFDDEL